MSDNLHDEINLRRLIRRLEKSTSDSQWTTTSDDTWIKVQGALQKVKYARKLLANAELVNVDPSQKSLQRYADMKTKIDRIEAFMQALEKKTAPKQTRPEPVLPSIPLPLAEPEPNSPKQQRASPPETIDVPGEDPSSASFSADNLLYSVSDVARSSFSSSVSPPLTTLLPPSFPSSSAKSATTAIEPRLMQYSNARQRDMADQMALMAEQLKRNAVHFAELLEKDKSVVQDTEQKLEGNYGYMQKTRIRTRDLRGKTGSTTCLVVLIVLGVSGLFMFMVALIRFSGR
ncbi:hypothetical protein GGX14DRAFT_358735 [Mycena pura]|uniref:Synaptobrevin n=1 Tax=Mycena pura TaxID=153505 RepID=A0AAD6YEB9_9AGAR|nr:hypothetical protein GGX14DRAFT_358735 [Mycena pura]